MVVVSAAGGRHEYRPVTNIFPTTGWLRRDWYEFEPVFVTGPVANGGLRHHIRTSQ